jgi:sugar phosphate isomerase/epimerase
MHVGLLTAPLRTKPLTQIIPWAASKGVQALEIDVTAGSHLDACAEHGANLEQIQSALKTHGVRISSLACYVRLVGVDAERAAQARQTLERTIELAGRLGVQVVCTLAGFPTPGKSKAETIAQDLPATFQPILDFAGQRGIKLALENWFATNIQHLDHWRLLFETIPAAHLGLNFDPSHLDWQGIDAHGAVREFQDRIFHVHAKDVSVDAAKLARVGYQGEDWWRYVLPGYGRINWGDFIGVLREVGYDDVLSIEHEDKTYGPEDGFTKAARYLGSLVY